MQLHRFFGAAVVKELKVLGGDDWSNGLHLAHQEPSPLGFASLVEAVDEELNSGVVG